MFVIRLKKIFLGLGILLTLASLYMLFTKGLTLGVDFKGGSLVEVEYASGRPEKALLEDVLAKSVGEVSARETGENGYIIRTKELSPEERKNLLASLEGKDGAIKRFDTVGPVLGAELQKKSLTSIVLVILAIVLFISFAFRKVSKPVSSLKYGLVAIVALIHDVVVPIGVFAFLGIEVDALFVTALLVVLGFSIHDTIVVFDRIRENLKVNDGEKVKKTFAVMVGESLSQTFARSINTSLTTLISLAVLFLYGPEATKNFALALLIGITAGTYSSIFLASPLLVMIEGRQKKVDSK